MTIGWGWLEQGFAFNDIKPWKKSRIRLSGYMRPGHDVLYGEGCMVDCHNMRSLIGAGCLFIALLLVEGASAQATLPEFDVDIVSKQSPSFSLNSQVEVYTRIPYTSLSFISTANGFTAHYEVSLEVTHVGDDALRKNIVQTREWEGNVVVPTYAATQGDEYSDFTLQTLDIAPGPYMFELQVEDKESSQVFLREVPVRVRDFNKPVAVSDLTLLASFDEKGYKMIPLVADRVGSEKRAVKIFYEVYAGKPHPVKISQKVIRSEVGVGNSKVRDVFTKSKGVTGEIVYQKVDDTTLKARRNQFVVSIPIDAEKIGKYTVQITVGDTDGNIADVVEKSFSTYWSGLHEHVRNLDDAIAQLEYIAKKKDLKYIESAKTDEERYRRFEEFWDKRDPTPGTSRNERMEEYYYRVAFANTKYGSLTAGWKTDRGYVMVRYGEPDAVEHHPFSFNAKPYEVWYYYRIGRRFIFIDETGLGDYQLQTPVWDERTRIH